MSLPLVTRFGADPLLDLEVANKRYVDNAGGGIFIFGNQQDGDVQTGSVTWSLWNTGTGFTVGGFATLSVPLGINFNVIFVSTNIFSNGKVAPDLVFSVQAEGVQSDGLTVGAGLSGDFDSGAISFAVLATDEVSFHQAPAGAGNIRVFPLTAVGQAT